MPSARAGWSEPCVAYGVRRLLHAGCSLLEAPVPRRLWHRHLPLSCRNVWTLCLGAPAAQTIARRCGCRPRHGDGPWRGVRYGQYAGDGTGETGGLPADLVGDGLLDCLEALAKTHPATREELHSRSLAERCRGVITSDPVDRASILDPLGEEMRSLGLYSSADIERLHEYVASQALRFSGPHGPGQTAPGCDEAEASRLRVYYARLLAYLEPRLHLWRR